MRKIEVIEVVVTNPLRGGISSTAVAGGTHFLAAERAPGIWRVNDGSIDFTFSQTELEDSTWIQRVDE